VSESLTHPPAATLESVRRFEVEKARPWLQSGMRVLEIGGGDGLQASVIASWGCQVNAIDIAGRPKVPKTWFPVQDYDGVHLPYPDLTFDAVFSSNVLEHVREVPVLLKEIHRVLKPKGCAIHILPGTAWRAWTILTHYLETLFRLIGIRKAGDDFEHAGIPVPTSSSQAGWLQKVKNRLIPPPHGEYALAVQELYTFSARRWLTLFKDQGFRVIDRKPIGLFYTGHMLFPGLHLGLRQTLARFAGSACSLFVMEKA
jgi:SAM-dependent methyltransferase